MLRRLVAILATLGLALLVATPAFAVPINQTLPLSSATFKEGSASECSEFTVPEGKVLWHFILNQSDTNNQTLSVTFQNAGTTSGIVAYKVVDSFVLHYQILTNDPDTLTAASTSGSTGMLLLSHVCHHVPPPVIPESPLPVLIAITGGLTALWFVSRKLGTTSATAA